MALDPDTPDFPCPWCGSRAEPQLTRFAPWTRLWQRCTDCGMAWEPPAEDLDREHPLGPTVEQMCAELAADLDALSRDLSFNWLREHRPDLFDGLA